MHDEIFGHGIDRVGGDECCSGMVVGVGDPGVGASPVEDAHSGNRSWFAGPYGDQPIKANLAYSASEIDALTDHWNRVLFLRFALAGGLSGVRSVGVCRPATVGVR